MIYIVANYAAKLLKYCRITKYFGLITHNMRRFYINLLKRQAPIERMLAYYLMHHKRLDSILCNVLKVAVVSSVCFLLR